ncbi:hypothetical protein CYMTET_9752, partial [Cymbomonas tetramitiformis]
MKSERKRSGHFHPLQLQKRSKEGASMLAPVNQRGLQSSNSGENLNSGLSGEVRVRTATSSDRGEKDMLDPENGMSAYPEKKTYQTAAYHRGSPVMRFLTSLDPKLVYFIIAVVCVLALVMGYQTSTTVFLILLTCLGMLNFAVYLAQWVLAKDEGTSDMTEVSEAIRDGAEGFFRTMYGTISKLACVLSVAIFVLYLFRPPTPEQIAAGLTPMTLAVVTTMSFLLGAFCSGLSGYIGMWVSVRANVRVAGAARRTAREALQVALRSGGFSGIMVVGMTVLGIGILFSTFFVFFGVGEPGNMKVND